MRFRPSFVVYSHNGWTPVSICAASLTPVSQDARKIYAERQACASMEEEAYINDFVTHVDEVSQENIA